MAGTDVNNVKAGRADRPGNGGHEVGRAVEVDHDVGLRDVNNVKAATRITVSDMLLLVFSFIFLVQNRSRFLILSKEVVSFEPWILAF